MIIRLANAMDLPGVLACLESLAPVGLTEQQAAKVFQEQLRHHIDVYVVQDQEQIVATGSLVLERKFIHQGGLSARIEDVAVRLDMQGHGYGTKLVQWLTNEAVKAGAYKVSLTCKPSLLEWYRRLGYKTNGDYAMRLNVE